MRFKILAAAVFVLLGGGALYLVSAKQQPVRAELRDVKVAKVSRGSIARTIRLTGQTSARQYVNINAPRPTGPESGKQLILLKLVKPGSAVRKGEEIATIDAQSTVDHIDDVEDTVKQADADIAKRKAEQSIERETLEQTIRQAKSDMEKARLDAQPKGILTLIERQLLEVNVEQTEARYRELLKSPAEQQASFAAEIRILEITALRQRRHLRRHQNDLRGFTIAAPMDGLAVMQMVWRGGDFGQVQQGDQLGPGQLFMKIVDPKSMQLEARANQAETSELRIGQKVTVRFDAFPGLELPGAVYSIGALATGSWMQNYYLRTIPVNITLRGLDARLIPDLSASGEVVLERAENVLVVPLAAVRDLRGHPTVRVREASEFVDRAITIGVHNESQAAVVTGLREGEEVRVN